MDLRKGLKGSYKQMVGRSVRTRKTDRVNEVIVRHGSTVWFIVK